MKILILANNDVGLYQFRKELIEKLLEKNEVIISLPYGELVEPLKKMGCKFINTSIDRRGINPIVDGKLLINYTKQLKRERPSLVITYTIKPNIYGGLLCRFFGFPYAINITGLGTSFEKENLLKKFVCKLYRLSCKNAKVVFFENEANRQLFVREKIVDEKKTHRLNGAGVNLKKYQVREYPRGEKVKFLFMGRVMAEKGVDELFVAMRKLIKDGLNCELHLLGGYEEAYDKIICNYEREGWLIYHGYIKDVRPYINECHCFVLPSWHEGMANTNLEAAASGRPIITSNIPGCREAVIDGKSGLLVEKKNSYDLYEKMKRFCLLPYEKRKEMGLLGRNHMEKYFDKNIIVKDTIDCL